MGLGWVLNCVIGLLGEKMVGGVVGLQRVALVGFNVGMGVGTLGVGACWVFMAWPEQRIHGATGGSWRCIGAICGASKIPHVLDSGQSCVHAGAWLLVVFVPSMVGGVVGFLGS